MRRDHDALTYRKALRLAAHADDNFVELSRLLRDLHSRRRDLFRDFVANSAMSRRTAYYLIGLDLDGASKTEISRMAAIGRIKLGMLCKNRDQAPWSELLTLAETQTARELARSLAAHAAQEKTRCVVLYFDPAEYARFEEHLLASGAIRRGKGLVAKEQALVRALEGA